MTETYANSLAARAISTHLDTVRRAQAERTQRQERQRHQTADFARAYAIALFGVAAEHVTWTVPDHPTTFADGRIQDLAFTVRVRRPFLLEQEEAPIDWARLDVTVLARGGWTQTAIHELPRPRLLDTLPDTDREQVLYRLGELIARHELYTWPKHLAEQACPGCGELLDTERSERCPAAQPHVVFTEETTGVGEGDA